MSVALLEAVQRDAVRGNHVREFEVFILHHEPEEHELVVLIIHAELERLLPDWVETIVIHMVRLELDCRLAGDK